jgi:hypothetical protein
MAAIVLTNAQVIINSVDLSDHVRSVTVTPSVDLQDKTAMGASYHARLGGLKDYSLELELNQDFASGSVDATLFPLLGVSTSIEVRPVNGSRSATNPGYTGNAILESYKPVSGKVGDMLVTTASFKGDGALARQTS